MLRNDKKKLRLYCVWQILEHRLQVSTDIGTQASGQYSMQRWLLHEKRDSAKFASDTSV
jgi:hypothetical protein